MRGKQNGALFLGEQLVQLGTVEADHDIGVIDDDYRNAHLVRFFHHLPGGVPVCDDVMVGIRDFLFRKILFHFLAVRSGRRGIDDHFLIRHILLPARVIA